MSAEAVPPSDEYPLQAGGPAPPPAVVRHDEIEAYAVVADTDDEAPRRISKHSDDAEAKDVKPVVEPDDRYQFTLAEMFGLFVVAAMFFSLVSLLGRTAEAFAGALGLAVLIGLAVVEVLGVRRPIVRVAWWAALLTYLVACVATLVLAP